MERRTCHFSGRVQGVGFRFTAAMIARQFDVSGYVQNLDDGRVRLVAEGEADEIERVLSAIEDRMAGYIREVRSETSPASGEFTSFSIRA